MNPQLRVLKERRRTYPGGVPTAGLNATRRQAWQGQLPFIHPPSSTPSALTELLLLWDYASFVDQETGFTLRVVHPTEPGDYGRAVRCDLDLAIQPGGTIFTQLFFSGDPDELDFFAEVDEINETGSGD